MAHSLLFVCVTLCLMPCSRGAGISSHLATCFIPSRCDVHFSDGRHGSCRVGIWSLLPEVKEITVKLRWCTWVRFSKHHQPFQHLLLIPYAMYLIGDSRSISVLSSTREQLCHKRACIQHLRHDDPNLALCPLVSSSCKYHRKMPPCPRIVLCGGGVLNCWVRCVFETPNRSLDTTAFDAN